MSETNDTGAVRPALTEPFEIGGVPIANRVLLARLAGIGTWFVRLQAKRHGAGLAVSEMVSRFALHYRNERTLRELMRIHPDEHPVSIQLFGPAAGAPAGGAEARAPPRGPRAGGAAPPAPPSTWAARCRRCDAPAPERSC